MNLPPSSLLGRLEAFLPEMEKANEITEKLAQAGKLDVLDSSLEVAGTDQHAEGAEGTREGTDDGAAEEQLEEDEGGKRGRAGAVAAGRTVQLDFALGDFDDTPIAKMEEAKGDTAGQVDGVEAGASGSTPDELDEGEDAGVAVDDVVRVVVPDEEADAAEPPEKPRKPLIEEL